MPPIEDSEPVDRLGRATERSVDGGLRVMLFGASGMVGQGVLRECLLDPEVEVVLSIGRAAIGHKHAKLQEIVRRDVGDLADVEEQLRGWNACFFCLGVSSVGMKEEDYRRVTYDLTLAVAETLVKLNPDMIFIYVSGEGTDSTEQGKVMWARVKGATENALGRLPFKATYAFRPGIIQPLHGIRSKTKVYRILYVVLRPLLALIKLILPTFVTNTEQVGLAMIRIAKRGSEKRVLNNRDINEIR